MGDFNNQNENNNNQSNTDQNQYQQPTYNSTPDQNQYQQPMYQQPQYQQNYQQPDPSSYQNQQQFNQYQQQPPKKNVGMAVASMVCGIVSILFLCMWYIALPVAIVGLVLGIVSIKKTHDGKGMAIAGIIISSISLLIAILFIIGCAALFNNNEFMNELNNLSNEIESY